MEAAEISIVAHSLMSTRLAVAQQKGQCLSLEILKTQLEKSLSSTS